MAIGNVQKACPRGGGESVQQGRSIACCVPQGATVVGARSVHPVRDTAKGRERRWRLFSTFPFITQAMTRAADPIADAGQRAPNIHTPLL